MASQDLLDNIRRKVSKDETSIIRFLREIVAIPSVDSKIRQVGERIGTEMERLGFEFVRFDVQGNIIGKIGSGPRVIVYDSHIDTVGVGNIQNWAHDPFQGAIKDGYFYGRGTCDEKGSTPGMVYGLAYAKQMGLIENATVFYFGNMEEWCDGIAPRVFCEIDPAIKPDIVLVGEPTNMAIYRGHKGRVELEITSKGKSAHAASNFLGKNAIYQILPVIQGIQSLEPKLATDPFLGQGRITVTDMKVTTPSINAVPDHAKIFIDRRLTFGESVFEALRQLQKIIDQQKNADIKMEILTYSEPSYTGFQLVVEKKFPAWALDETHPLVKAGQAIRVAIGLPTNPTGKWDFSTNATYWAGIEGIPTIGFAPGDERTAHASNECVNLSDVLKSVEFYALFPQFIDKFDV
ncbi:MAG TPA: YgeY family selenium metabolism-linked hydrolase [Anaerolineae bacterium]|nr:YgeY family selenium metabolism-linked hydrolase [Anaerolineae bacterium]